jgi:subtilisin family serine protease
MMRGDMSISRVAAFFLLLFSVAWIGVAGPGSQAVKGPPVENFAYAPDHVIVKYKPGLTAGTSLGASMSVVRNYRFIRASLVRVPSGQTAPGLVKELSRNPRVEYAELDYVRTADTVPNDALFSQLWGMQNTGQTGGTAGADIDAPAAWSITTGSSSVIVGVIDTGIDYTHEDLQANMWTNPGEIPNNGIDDDGNGYIDDYYGINAIDHTGDPMDDYAPVYHGTHCSGTIGAVGNNGIGVVGVNWTVRLMGLKFLGSDGKGYTSNAITCIQYAIDKGANILSNSWGGSGYDQSLKDAIDAAQAAGILFVAAAGNKGLNTDVYPNYPSCYDSDNIISVAATDDNDQLASFWNWGSNYGPTTVDVAAPGVSILSTKEGNAYQYLSGTSMATPHVSGLAALLKAHNSTWDWQAIKSRILAGTVPLGSLTGKVLTQGRINAYNSLVADLTVPHIYSLEPSSAPPGSWIDVMGYGFEESQGAGFVLFGGGYQATVSSWSDDLIHCQVPSLAQAGDVTVQNSSGQVSNGAYFSLAPVIVVTSPAGGDVWSPKSQQTVAWTKAGTQNANVKIQLFRGTKKVKDINLKTPNDGSYAWKVPGTIASASNYRVRVQTVDGKVTGFSGYFSIAKPTLTITAPTAGTAWPKGSTQAITWTKTGDQNASVSLYLFRGTTKVQTIATSAPNSGSYDWPIPAGLATASNYKIKIKTVDGLVKATSAKFTIN